MKIKDFITELKKANIRGRVYLINPRDINKKCKDLKRTTIEGWIGYTKGKNYYFALWDVTEGSEVMEILK